MMTRRSFVSAAAASGLLRAATSQLRAAASQLRIDRNTIFGGQLQIARNDSGIVGRHSAVDEFLAERHLDAVKTEPGRERNRVGVGGQLQVPVRYPDS